MYYCNNRDVFFSFCSLFFYGFAWNWMLWAVNKWNQVIIIPDNLFSFLFVRTRQKIQFHTKWTCGCSDVEANERARVCITGDIITKMMMVSAFMCRRKWYEYHLVVILHALGTVLTATVPYTKAQRVERIYAIDICVCNLLLKHWTTNGLWSLRVCDAQKRMKIENDE